MNLTPAELAAFADGELGPKRHAEIEHALAADPKMAQEVEKHRALRARLSAHYAPILDEPVSERLRGLLQRPDNIVNLAEQRESRSTLWSTIPRWGWIAGPALAACLILALFVPRGSAPEGYVGQQVAVALDEQLVATQPANAPVRVLLSFRDGSGGYCRAYTGPDYGGIACKDTQGWRLVERINGGAARRGEYRQAGSASSELMAQVQEIANGPALDAEQEKKARRGRWGQRQ